MLARIPLLVGPEPGAGSVAQRQSHVVDGQFQDALSAQGAPERSDDLVGHLVRTAEHVRVVKIDLSHPLQSGDHT